MYSIQRIECPECRTVLLIRGIGAKLIDKLTSEANFIHIEENDGGTADFMIVECDNCKTLSKLEL